MDTDKNMLINMTFNILGQLYELYKNDEIDYLDTGE